MERKKENTLLGLIRVVHQMHCTPAERDVRDGVRTPPKLVETFKIRVLKSFEASRKSLEIASGHAVWERQAGPLTGFNDSGSCAPRPRAHSCEPPAPPAAAPEAAAASRASVFLFFAPGGLPRRLGCAAAAALWSRDEQRLG